MIAAWRVPPIALALAMTGLLLASPVDGSTPGPPCTQIQFQAIVKKAVAGFDARMKGGAGAPLRELAADWRDTAQVGQDNDPVTWGQVWNVAELFYARLASEGFTSATFDLQAENPEEDDSPVSVPEIEKLFTFNLAPPAAPAHVVASVAPDGSVEVGWTKESDNASLFFIESSKDKGATWKTVGESSPDVSSYTVPADKAGDYGFTQFRVVASNPAGRRASSETHGKRAGDGVAVAIRPLNTQQYAFIDMSGTSTEGADVVKMVMDDNNNAAFGFYKERAFYTFTWRAGVLGKRQDTPLYGTVPTEEQILPQPAPSALRSVRVPADYYEVVRRFVVAVGVDGQVYGWQRQWPGKRIPGVRLSKCSLYMTAKGRFTRFDLPDAMYSMATRVSGDFGCRLENVSQNGIMDGVAYLPGPDRQHRQKLGFIFVNGKFMLFAGGPVPGLDVKDPSLAAAARMGTATPFSCPARSIR